MYNVILIDDEKWALVAVRKIFKFEENGFKIIAELTEAASAFDVICEKRPHVVFVDVRMPKMSGIELIRKVREASIETTFIVVSGFSDFNYVRDALREGAFDYLLKPISFEDAEGLLKKLLAYMDKKYDNVLLGLQENTTLNQNFIEILTYVNRNYCQDLNLKEIASKYFINYTYCCDLFKKKTGKSFLEYILALRMEKARELLRETTISIEEMALTLGYNDPYYFCKVFKKYNQISVNQYRKIENSLFSGK